MAARIFIGLLIIIASFPVGADSEATPTNYCAKTDRLSAETQRIQITNSNVKKSAKTGVTGRSMFIEFQSEWGFIHEIIGLPLIGTHYPFNEGIPSQISGQKYGSDPSQDSIIIPEHATRNAGVISLHGITDQTSKLLLLGIAALFGFLATRCENLIVAVAGRNNEIVNNLFFIGAAIGFFGGIFVIQDIKNLFGENNVVYFDNANSSAYRIVVRNEKSFDVGAGENIAVYISRRWNDLDVYPNGDGEPWCGKIFVRDDAGYLVFNIGAMNSYSVRTSVWSK